MRLHHATRLHSFTPVTEFGWMMFPSAIAFLLAWLLLTIWLRARERKALLEQISSVEAEYDKLGDEHHNLKQDYQRLRSSHEILYHEMTQKERNLGSLRSAILLGPTPPIQPPRASHPPVLAAKSWANPYESVYRSFFSDQLLPDWESRLRDAGLDIRRVGVGLHTRSETEEAGVYPITDDPQGNFYLLTDSRAQQTYILPAPWVQFNSRNLTRQLEPFYVASDFGSGAIERILDPARITPIGDPRWRVERKGQIQFKGSAYPPTVVPRATDPGACAEPRRRTNFPPAADTWVPNYVTLYNSYDAGWTSEAWEQALEAGGIDLRRVEVSLLAEDTGFLLPDSPCGSFYILTDANGRRDYYLVPAPWCQINSLPLVQQIRVFYVCPNLGSGKVERLLEAAQVARDCSSWRVERRGRIQFMASTNIFQLRFQRPTVDSAQLLQQPIPWSVLPEVSEHCPLLPSFPQSPAGDPPRQSDHQAESVVPWAASVDPPPVFVSTRSNPSEGRGFTSSSASVTQGPEAETAALEDPPERAGFQDPYDLDALSDPELESSTQNVPQATNIDPPKEPPGDHSWMLPSVPARTECPEGADTDPPLSERLGPPPQTPAADEGTLKPAEILNRYRMVALKVHPLRLDHKMCERVMFDAFDEVNLVLRFSGVTFLEGIQDEVWLDKARRDFALVWGGPECYLLPLPWLDYVDPDPSRSRALRALFDRHEGKEFELLGSAVLCQQSHDSYRVVKKGQVRF